MSWGATDFNQQRTGKLNEKHGNINYIWFCESFNFKPKTKAVCGFTFKNITNTAMSLMYILVALLRFLVAMRCDVMRRLFYLRGRNILLSFTLQQRDFATQVLSNYKLASCDSLKLTPTTSCFFFGHGVIQSDVLSDFVSSEDSGLFTPNVFCCKTASSLLSKSRFRSRRKNPKLVPFSHWFSLWTVNFSRQRSYNRCSLVVFLEVYESSCTCTETSTIPAKSWKENHVFRVAFFNSFFLSFSWRTKILCLVDPLKLRHKVTEKKAKRRYVIPQSDRPNEKPERHFPCS